MTEFCPDCDRELAADYPSWQFRDDTCGMSPAWNDHGERHDDCINECLLASRNRYRDEAAARDETLARVERQCAEALARMRAEKAELRLEVAAWRALAEWCAGRPQRRIDSQELFGKRNVAVQDCVGNERVSEWFDTTGPAAIDLARKLQLIPAEPDAPKETP